MKKYVLVVVLYFFLAILLHIVSSGAEAEGYPKLIHETEIRSILLVPFCAIVCDFSNGIIDLSLCHRSKTSFTAEAGHDRQHSIRIGGQCCFCGFVQSLQGLHFFEKGWRKVVLFWWRRSAALDTIIIGNGLNGLPISPSRVDYHPYSGSFARIFYYTKHLPNCDRFRVTSTPFTTNIFQPHPGSPILACGFDLGSESTLGCVGSLISDTSSFLHSLPLKISNNGVSDYCEKGKNLYSKLPLFNAILLLLVGAICVYYGAWNLKFGPENWMGTMMLIAGIIIWGLGVRFFLLWSVSHNIYCTEVQAVLSINSLNSICGVFKSLIMVSSNRYGFSLLLNLQSNSSRYASICLELI